MKKFILLVFLLLSSCATKNIIDLKENQFIAIANDNKGLPSSEDSLENAMKLAKNKCGEREVVVESVASRNDTYNFPETSLTFHCK